MIKFTKDNNSDSENKKNGYQKPTLVSAGRLKGLRMASGTSPVPTHNVTNGPTNSITNGPTTGVTSGPTTGVTNGPTNSATSSPTAPFYQP